MIKALYRYAFLSLIFSLSVSFSVFSSEWSLDADINTRAEYSDNIFLTDENQLSATGVIVKPSLFGTIKEKHWDAALAASVRISKYSDESLDGNDQFFDFTGRYIAERNIFSLNVNYDLDSNLSSTSTDFGIAGRRVNRKTQSIAPQYTRLLSERFVLMLSYSYTSVEYLEAENTGFVPYVTENLGGSLIYDMTEKDKLTMSLSAVDYKSRDGLITYQLFVSRIGVDHKFTRRLSSDFSLGVSRRNSTSTQIQTFDFFGQPILVNQVIDTNNRGLVLDAGVKYLFETGLIDARISRDETSNSFGGLDEKNRIKISFKDKLSDLWRYNIRGSLTDIASINSGSNRSNRDIFEMESVASYIISTNWKASASYRYIARQFKSDSSDDRAPHSNRYYLSLSYNFPSLSTF